MNINDTAKAAEYEYVLNSLKQCLSELIHENDFEYCYRIQLEQYDLIVKDDIVSELLESLNLE